MSGRPRSRNDAPPDLAGRMSLGSMGYLADRTMTGDALTAIRSPPRRTRSLPSRLTAARADVTARTVVLRDGFQYTRFTPPE